jgi:carboxyl-terminal processing protease
LQDALTQFDHSSALVIDLRGNPGGSLYSAIDAAKLFLAPNQSVVSLQTRNGIETYRKESSTPPIPVRLYLWQDKYTASAAEVFIAALTYNQRAVSIGKKTFGKGTVQDIVELQDGSVLYLTTGILLTPAGTLYHQKGLTPTYPLEMATARTENYLAQVRVLLRHSKTTPHESKARN